MPGPEAVAVIPALRVVADPVVLDGALAWALGARLADLGARVLRLAPDDLLVLSPGAGGGVLGALQEEIAGVDHHAILATEAGFAGAWCFAGDVRRWVAANADWLLPAGDGLSQGQVAGLPVKILVDGDDALVLAPTPIAHELAPRLEWPA
ncbi:MAG: hypothetical protein R2761_09285 [Acidimicrobiales bacterium]